MDALNAHLDDENSPARCRIMLRQVMETLYFCFELDRTFSNTWRFERLRRNRSEPRDSELLPFISRIF
jgi:hypothetical protein